MKKSAIVCMKLTITDTLLLMRLLFVDGLIAQKTAFSSVMFLIKNQIKPHSFRLTVEQATSFPIRVKNHATRLILVILESIPIDHIFDVVLQGEAGEVLPKLVDHVSELALESKLRKKNG